MDTYRKQVRPDGHPVVNKMPTNSIKTGLRQTYLRIWYFFFKDER